MKINISSLLQIGFSKLNDIVGSLLGLGDLIQWAFGIAGRVNHEQRDIRFDYSV